VLGESNPNETDHTQGAASPGTKKEKEQHNKNPLFQGVLKVKRHRKKDNSDI